MNNPKPFLRYRPRTFKPPSWEEIEQHYVMLSRSGWKVEKAIELIEHIKSSSLSQRLFGCTSHASLHITIYDSVEWGRETLIITIGSADAPTWDFTYFSQPFRKPTFKRTYPPDVVIEKFDNFIKMIGW